MAENIEKVTEMELDAEPEPDEGFLALHEMPISDSDFTSIVDRQITFNRELYQAVVSIKFIVSQFYNIFNIYLQLLSSRRSLVSKFASFHFVGSRTWYGCCRRLQHAGNPGY